MALTFRLPDIGEGVAEGEIVKWFVAEGDTVGRDQPMVEVLTDKASVEIPAPRAGTILRILAREGDVVPVETALVVIGDPGESVELPAGEHGHAAATDGHGRSASGGATAADRDGGGRDAGRGPEPRADRSADSTSVPPRPARAAGEPGTEGADAPPAVRSGLREQPRPPDGPVRVAEREEAEARAAADASAGAGDGPGRRGGGVRGGDGRAGDGRSAAAPAGRARISPTDRVLAMPAVRRFARERGVDLSAVEPTGSQGHVLRGDVERFLAAAPGAAAQARPRRAAAEREAAPATRRAALPPPVRRAAAEGPEEELVPYRGVRRMIGRRMSESVYTAPHYTYVEEVDAGALVAFRDEAQPVAEERGVRLTYLPIIVKALVPCLRTYPLLNAVLDEEAGQIRLRKRYHIGIAVASEEGLVVPVLRDADRLSVLEIASELRRLSDAARDRSVAPDDLKGSTFTITSLGPLGGLLATPIINYPEVAILGVHAIKQKPVVRDGAVVPGHVMNLSLSFDHRVVDGAVGAEFTRMLVRYLENPSLLLLES
jgi:pyruvate dehydrogenase E2 component (dihydrolipoamide acetyltransferase)